jgi:hypothetical protein
VLAGAIGSGSGSTARGPRAEYGCVTIFSRKLARYLRARSERICLPLRSRVRSYLIRAARRRSRATVFEQDSQYSQRASHSRQSSSATSQWRQQRGRSNTEDRHAACRELDPFPRDVRKPHARGARGVHTPPAPGRLGGSSSGPSILGPTYPVSTPPPSTRPSPRRSGHDRPAPSVIEIPRFSTIASKPDRAMPLLTAGFRLVVAAGNAILSSYPVLGSVPHRTRAQSRS